MKVPENERARERKFPGRERKVSGTKVPQKYYSFLGTKGLGHEKSWYRILPVQLTCFAMFLHNLSPRAQHLYKWPPKNQQSLLDLLYFCNWMHLFIIAQFYFTYSSVVQIPWFVENWSIELLNTSAFMVIAEPTDTVVDDTYCTSTVILSVMYDVVALQA